MDIKKTLGKSLGGVVGIFIVISIFMAIVGGLGSVAPLLDTGGNETVTEEYETDHSPGWLSEDNVLDVNDFEETDEGHVYVSNGSTLGSAKTESDTQELLDFIDTEGTENETTPGYAYVGLDMPEDNVSLTGLAITVENPDQDDSTTFEFNESELRTHYDEEGDERYILPFWSEDLAFLGDDTDGTYELLIEMDTNSSESSEGSVELVEWGLGYEKETVEDVSDYPGSDILPNLGMLVLAFGGLIGLIVVLFSAVMQR